MNYAIKEINNLNIYNVLLINPYLAFINNKLNY